MLRRQDSTIAVRLDDCCLSGAIAPDTRNNLQAVRWNVMQDRSGYLSLACLLQDEYQRDPFHHHRQACRMYVCCVSAMDDCCRW